MRRFGTLLASCCAIAMMAGSAAYAGDKAGTLVEYRSGNTTLRGVVYKPEGKGPFPAVVFERSTNSLLDEKSRAASKLSEFYTSHGFIFFITSRHDLAQLRDEEKSKPVAEKRRQNKTSLPEYEVLTREVAAAVNWIKVQPYVDESRIVVVGYAMGATISLFAAEQEIGVRAFVLFSPSAEFWNERADLRGALADAVKEAKEPIFLIQAQNDYCLGPSQVLGKQIATRGKPNLCKVYPPYGTSNVEGNRFANSGMSVWGDDVVEFMSKAIN